MAIFPQGRTKVIDRARGGEKRLLEALARKLEDDYSVWHNIPITDAGIRRWITRCWPPDLPIRQSRRSWQRI